MMTLKEWVFRLACVALVGLGILGFIFLSIVAFPPAPIEGAERPIVGRFAVDGPVHDGEEITVDLLETQHMRNTGGMGLAGPGSGAGLCVFTSIEVSTRYQNIQELSGFQKWMTRKPGGGYPEKLTDMITQFCREKAVKEPSYIQHTGGDMEFLRAALKTGRMVSVTYAGRDGVYYPTRIAHMVNLVHLSDKWAVILDNNNPGKYLWMSPEEFRSRWLDMSGGWAVVMLGAPPAPIPTSGKPVVRFAKMPDFAQISYRWYEDKNERDTYYLFAGEVHVGTSKNGKYRALVAGQWVDAEPPIPLPGAVIAPKVAPKAEPKKAADGHDVDEDLKPDEEENHGIDSSMFANRIGEAIYSLNGRRLSKREAMTAIGDSLPNDRAKKFLVCVGDENACEKFRAMVEKLDATLKIELHIQVYPSGHWDATRIGLADGVSLISPPDSHGRGRVIWRYRQMPTIEQLSESLRKTDGTYKPNDDVDPLAKSVPKVPDVTPVKPDGGTSTGSLAVVLSAIAGIMLFFRKWFGNSNASK